MLHLTCNGHFLSYQFFMCNNMFPYLLLYCPCFLHGGCVVGGMDHYLIFITKIEVLCLLNTSLWIQDYKWLYSKILLKCIVQNIKNVHKQYNNNTGLHKQNKNGLNHEWNRSISKREQLAFALILEGNVGQKGRGHKVLSVSFFTVPKYMLFKPLFNYTNQMHNIYSLCTFTVFLLQVIVLHSPSSVRIYMPFT